MADQQKPFDSFRLKLNKKVSREKAVDDALRLLEQQYFTSDDAESEIESRVKNPERRFKDISRKLSDGKKNEADRAEVLDEILFLLENARLNSDDALRIKKKRRGFAAGLFLVLGIALICFAALMIVYESQEWFKGPTLYYFNPTDGITLSDVISILMIGGGTLLLFLSYNELRKK